jgi:hypothetical protein
MIAYSHAVFDVVWSVPSGKVTQPKIVIAIQNSLFYTVGKRIVEAIDKESTLLYSVVIFDTAIQIYDFSRNAWRVICDGEDFCLPAPAGSLFAVGGSVALALGSAPSPVSGGCDLQLIAAYVSCFENTKLVLVLAGPISSAPRIECPCAVAIIGPSTVPFVELREWFSKLTVVAMHTRADSERLSLFFRDNLSEFANRADLFVRHARSIHVQTEDVCTFSIGQGQVHTIALFFVLQFEVRFLDTHCREIRRFVTIRVPSSPLSKIYQSAAFPSPVQHASAALSLILSRLRRSPDLDRRRLAEDLVAAFPMQHSIWPSASSSLLASPIWEATVSAIERDSYFLSLHISTLPVNLLSFVPLDLVNGHFIPASLNPQSPPDARITLDGILIATPTFPPQLHSLNNIPRSRPLS